MLDIVLVIDASGSITAKGFDIMKNFSSHIVKRIQGKFAQVAVVQFGNGKLLTGGVVSEAILGAGFSDDMDKVSETIMGLTYQKGFTNLAQGLLKAKDLQSS